MFATADCRSIPGPSTTGPLSTLGLRAFPIPGKKGATVSGVCPSMRARDPICPRVAAPFPASRAPGWGRVAPLLLLALFSLPGVALAQSGHELVPGSRIRVTQFEIPALTGTFQSSGATGLTMTESGESPRVIANQSIERLELSTGKNRATPALIGGAVGLVAGVVLGGLTSGDCAGDCDDPYGVGGSDLGSANATATGALIGGVVFGGLGALLGGTLFASENWTQLSIPAGR